MLSANQFDEELVNGNGFKILESYVDNESFAVLKSAITRQFNHVNSKRSGICAQFDELILAHKDLFLSPIISELSVYDRTLDESSSELVSDLPFVKALQNLTHFEVIDCYGFGYPTFTWRLTRPHCNSDFRGLHRDAWFRYVWGGDKIIDNGLDTAIQTIKIWIAIHVVPGQSGLLVVPESQMNRAAPKYTAVNLDGMVKPVIDQSELDNLSAELAEMSPRDLIVFGEQLVHGGGPNTSDACRISLEFTLGPKGFICPPIKFV